MKNQVRHLGGSHPQPFRDGSLADALQLGIDPRWLLKFSFRASAETQGESRTQPTSDQVPELMKPQSSPCAGIPAIAEAVSWHAGAINFVFRNAAREASVPCTRPMSVPGFTSGGAAPSSRPAAAKISGHQSGLCTNRSWVCVALVYSETRRAPSQCMTNSGTLIHGKPCSVSRSASNWYRVFRPRI